MPPRHFNRGLARAQPRDLSPNSRRRQIHTWQAAGGIGEARVAEDMQGRGYSTQMAPDPNTPGYDLIAEKCRRRYVIQVKTDANGNGQYPDVNEETLRQATSELGGTAVVARYNPYGNTFRYNYLVRGDQFEP